MSIEKIKSAIRDVKDFPKPGILFKDITPLLHDPELTREIVTMFAQSVKHLQLDAICGVESRGFFFGLLLAQELNIPFVPVRKKGKLPFKTHSYTYDLEYGTATIEMHVDAIQPGWNVLVHDDLLATGGTACAAAELVQKQGGKVPAFAFLVTIDSLNGEKSLTKYTKDIISLLNF